MDAYKLLVFNDNQSSYNQPGKHTSSSMYDACLVIVSLVRNQPAGVHCAYRQHA